MNLIVLFYFVNQRPCTSKSKFRPYVTTIGLYNDENELVAVAKMSQPLSKDFTKEALIKVKLDY